MSSKKTGEQDNEIVTSRLVNAPRELVWAAYSDPAHITHWWGPRGFSTTTSEMDMRPGGTWRFVMHGPDGTDYKNKVVYIEAVKPERLVFNHSGEDETADIKFVSHVTFEDQDGKTLVTLRAIFKTKAERDAIETRSNAREGGRQTLARLNDYLASVATSPGKPTGQPFVITRVVNAPRDLVWKAWTQAEHLQHWWGPKGSKIEVKTLDLRPGGVFHYAMRYSTGAVMWGRFTFQDIVAPERLVFLNGFANEAGEIARAPFPGAIPLQMENTVNFSEHAGKTTINLHSLPFNASDEERMFFEGMFASMQGGYGGTFEQLETYLAKMQRP